MNVVMTLQLVTGSAQWRGNYFRTQGGARPRAPKSGARNKVLRFAEIGVFFIPNTSVL